MAGNFPHIYGDQRITAIGSYQRLTYSMRSRNDSRSYHVFNIDDLLRVVHVWTTPSGSGRGFFKIHIFSGGPDILHSMNYCSKTN